MLAKAQASEASSKAKVEACGSKVKVEACGSKAKLQASTKTLIVKRPVPITNCVLRVVNAKTWDAIKGKTFGVQIPSTMAFAKVKIGNKNLRSGNSDSLEDRKGASKVIAPIFYGPSTQGLLDAYGYNTIEEYLSMNYFPSTDNESTDMETALLTLTLQRLEIRQRGKERCHVEADHALAFDQSFLGSLTCLHIAFAACICTLHLYIAFASKHLHIALAHCICTLH
ncbi:hypothetical protein Tco_0484571 [Tanacetum coccineum]